MAEAVLDDSAAPNPGTLLDIEMMAFVGGKERTMQGVLSVTPLLEAIPV